MQSDKRHNMLKLWKLSRKHDFLYIYVSRFVNKVNMSHAMHHVHMHVQLLQKLFIDIATFFQLINQNSMQVHIYITTNTCKNALQFIPM